MLVGMTPIDEKSYNTFSIFNPTSISRILLSVDKRQMLIGWRSCSWIRGQLAMPFEVGITPHGEPSCRLGSAYQVSLSLCTM